MTATLSETDLAGVTADKVVDARGAACPGPLLEAKKAMGTVPIGAVIELWSSDPQTKNDIAAWCGQGRPRVPRHLSADGYERVFVRRRSRGMTEPHGPEDPGLLDQQHLRPRHRPGGQLAHALLPDVVVISLPCTSGIKPAWILHALERASTACSSPRTATSARTSRTAPRARRASSPTRRRCSRSTATTRSG